MNRQREQEILFNIEMGEHVSVTDAEMALLNNIPRQTRHRWRDIIHEYGVIPLHRKRKRRQGTTLNDRRMQMLRDIVHSRPDLYLDEIASKYMP
jgi:hypothetical protein